MKDKKIWYKQWWFILIVIFVVIPLILSPFVPKEESQNNPNFNQTITPENTENLTIEQKINVDITEIVNNKEINLTYFEDTKQLAINYNANDYSSEYGLQNEHTKIYKKLFESYDLQEISIFSWMNFVDTYGQETKMVGFRSTLDKETADKINWSNFYNTNLPKVADSYYVHPALV